MFSLRKEISYSAFLAACLCAHHSHLEEKHLRELFSKLDKEKTGKVGSRNRELDPKQLFLLV